VLLASQFQGFCRDLHSESVDYLIAAISPPQNLLPLVRAEFMRGRKLDRGNAQPASLGEDFNRLGIDLWEEVRKHDQRNSRRKRLLEALNNWRNAIAHHDFDPNKLGGTTTLRLKLVQRWRAGCNSLACSFDEVLRIHIQVLTGTSPW
jgi:hypothetical protein